MGKKSSFAKKLYQSMKFIYKLTDQCQKMDNYFLFENFCNSIGKLHFRQEGASEEEKRVFFKKQLAEIEIETHGFCNRSCSFCPNSQINRLDKNQIMPEGVFNKVIDDLNSLEYKNTIKLHRYNEPLALELIFDRIRYVRKQLHLANIGFHSNGDYITKEKLKQLEEAGLDFVEISLYINFNGGRQEQYLRAEKQCEDYIQKNDLKAERADNNGRLIRYVVPMERMRVSMYVADVQHQWVDRGGTIKDYSSQIRISPCEEPFRRLFIDWTGDVLPCCNLRGDVQSHKPYILGNVEKLTLQDIFYSEVSNKLRQHLVRFNEKDGVCRTCQYGTFYHTRRAEFILNKTLKKIGL